MKYYSDHHLIKINPESKRLTVFFSGTDKTNGKFDFWRVGNSQDSSVIFFNNGKNEWYQNGIPNLTGSIDSTANFINDVYNNVGATSILLCGVSMGGYAAMLYGSLINADILAFGFDSQLKIKGSRSEKRMPKDVQLNEPDLKPIVSKAKGRIHCFAGELDGMDMISSHHLHDLDNFNCQILRGVGHGAAPFIDKWYGLSEYIRKYANKEELPEIPESSQIHRNKYIVDTLRKSHDLAKEKNWGGLEELLSKPENNEEIVAANYYWRGIAALEMEEINNSIKYLSQSVALAPRHDTARYRLGRAFMAKKNIELAKSCFLQILENDKENFLSHIFLHDLYKEIGKHKEAKNYLSRAIEINPSSDTIKRRFNFYFGDVIT